MKLNSVRRNCSWHGIPGAKINRRLLVLPTQPEPRGPRVHIPAKKDAMARVFAGKNSASNVVRAGAFGQHAVACNYDARRLCGHFEEGSRVLSASFLVGYIAIHPGEGPHALEGVSGEAR